MPIGSSKLGPPVLGSGRFPPAFRAVPVDGVEYCCAAGVLDAGVLVAGVELVGELAGALLPPGRLSQAIPS